MNEEIIRQRWIWIKEHIREEYRLSNISYKTWIEGLEIADIRDDVVYIRIPSDKPIMLNYIVNNYKVFFQITITEMLDENYDVEFLLTTDDSEDEEPVEEQKTAVSSQQVESANLIPKYRFDTFIVGKNNSFAQSACVAVAESPGDTYNPLFLYGGAGLGKTHLMHSIGHYILEMNPSKRVLYVTSEQFTNEVIESIRSGNAASMARLRDKYRTVDILLIDDIQFIIGKESTQEEFFHTFNELYEHKKQIIISSDKPPKEIKGLEDRLISRFLWGLPIDLQSPNYETRVAILKKKIELDGSPSIPDDVIFFIAENVSSNIRELEGALTKIIAYSKLTSSQITLDLAKDVLKDLFSIKREVTPDHIIKTVAEYFDITESEMTSRKKSSDIVYPRQICMYLCRTMTDAALSLIGKKLGNRDHTTVLHGYEKIQSDIDMNETVKNDIETLKKKIRPY